MNPPKASSLRNTSLSKDSFIIISMICFSIKTMIFYHHLILMILQLKALKLWNQRILLLVGDLGEVITFGSIPSLISISWFDSSVAAAKKTPWTFKTKTNSFFQVWNLLTRFFFLLAERKHQPVSRNSCEFKSFVALWCKSLRTSIFMWQIHSFAASLSFFLA